MSSRKPGYLIGVILLALVMSAPQLILSFQLGVEAYQQKTLPRVSLPGLGGSMYGSVLNQVTFSRDRFLMVIGRPGQTSGGFDWNFSTIDPETGKTNDLEVSLSREPYCLPLSFGNRVWIFGTTGAYELVNGVLQPARIVAPRSWPEDGQRFLFNGEPSYVLRSGFGGGIGGFVVSTMKSGTWGIAGEVVLPTRIGDWTLDPRHATWLTCISQGDRIHVFLYAEGRLLYREGLELQTVSAVADPRGRSNVGERLTDEPVSALWAENSVDRSRGWTLAREQQHSQPVMNTGHLFGLMVGGQPAVLVVHEARDDPPDGYLVGYFRRFDGTRWSEFATHTFPFGTNMLRAVSSGDGQKSYIVASTTTGTAHVFAVEVAGIRKTDGASQQTSPVFSVLQGYAMVPVAMLVLGILLGLGTWFLMWRYSKPDYGFRVQTVKLASLGRRGLARLIDLGLIVLTTAGLGWAMTRGFDWLAWLEALNLKVDHPTIPIAARVTSILVVWLAGLVLSLLVIQARWGVTPGKWLCGLRMLRTTLKPCGFARSLVRETVICVDACNFLCWAPGILSIALTDCRQRLGDLVADTIVVEAASRQGV